MLPPGFASAKSPARGPSACRRWSAALPGRGERSTVDGASGHALPSAPQRGLDALPSEASRSQPKRSEMATESQPTRGPRRRDSMAEMRRIRTSSGEPTPLTRTSRPCVA